MKVILTPDMARELLNNEEQIKNQQGAYRPQYKVGINPYGMITKEYVPVIKCFPLDKMEGEFIQQRNVIPGMEKEVDDICIAKINQNSISYMVCKNGWSPTEYMYDYSILIYTPKFDNNAIYISALTLPQLFDKMKQYNLGKDIDTKNIDMHNLDDILSKIFGKYQGICTYILFKNDNVIGCGKWNSEKIW